MGQESLSGNFEKEKRTFTYKSATADLLIDSKFVWIDHLTAEEKDQGHGSELLNELKKEFPNHTISGLAQPPTLSNIPNNKEYVATIERLKNFYARNGFNVEEDGHFFSDPPHTLLA
jgi:hypothetical protein